MSINFVILEIKVQVTLFDDVLKKKNAIIIIYPPTRRKQ